MKVINLSPKDIFSMKGIAKPEKDLLLKNLKGEDFNDIITND